MPYHLVVVRGRSNNQGLRIPDEGVTTVGRQNGCQICIRSSQVSRKHCELYVENGRLVVKDLNSSNGTLVNGVRVDGRKILEPGSILSIGSIVFRVDDSNAPPAERPHGRPSDTAVAQGVNGGAGDELDFEIEADSETQLLAPSVPAPARPAPPAPANADYDDDAPLPVDIDGDAPADSPSHEPKELDEADVAGFLFDLDVDDDDKR